MSESLGSKKVFSTISIQIVRLRPGWGKKTPSEIPTQGENVPSDARGLSPPLGRHVDRCITRTGLIELCDDNREKLNLLYLRFVILKYNDITTLSTDCFIYADHLVLLDLSHNNVVHFAPSSGTNAIDLLNISHNAIRSVDLEWIEKTNKSISILDISSKPLSSISLKEIAWFRSLASLHTDDIRFCCFQDNQGIYYSSVCERSRV